MLPPSPPGHSRHGCGDDERNSVSAWNWTSPGKPEASNIFKSDFFLWRCDPTRVIASSFLMFLDHTQRRTTQSVGLLWTSDQLVAETSTWQHTTLTTDKHPCPPGGIRTHDLSRRAAADLRLRRRGYWDRHLKVNYFHKMPVVLHNGL